MNYSEKVFFFVRTLVAILLALLIGFIITLLVSEEPIEAFKLFLTGPLTSTRRMGNWIELAIPLTFTGLAVSMAFQAGQFNIGAEGQLFFGAVTATMVGVSFALPAYIHLPLTLLAAMLGGALVGFVPAILKAKWGASELVSSLMLNYVFYRLGLYFINHHFRDTRAGAMVSERLPQSAWLQQFSSATRIHWGLYIAIVAVIIVYLFLYRTKWGYALRMTGLNKEFAAYSGISVVSVILYSQIASGAIAGLAGASDLLGIFRRFQWQALPGYGFDGIIVAILAYNNPLAVPFGALFLAYIRTGASIMTRTTDVSADMVSIIQGIMILLVTAQAFLAKAYHRRVVKEAKKHDGNL